MAKAKNSWEELARKGAERIERIARSGEQLSLLPDEPGQTPDQTAGNSVGRPKGAQNKGSSQMRDWLAARGYRMPEDVLAQMAGLANHDEDVVMATFRDVERVLAWSHDGDKNADGDAVTPTGSQRVSLFLQLYAMRLRAAEALLPYGAAKASPDVQVNQRTTIVMPGASTPPPPRDPAETARDVTPQARRMAPPPMPKKMQQNQTLENSPEPKSDDQDWTE